MWIQKRKNNNNSKIIPFRRKFFVVHVWNIISFKKECVPFLVPRTRSSLLKGICFFTFSYKKKKTIPCIVPSSYLKKFWCFNLYRFVIRIDARQNTSWKSRLCTIDTRLSQYHILLIKIKNVSSKKFEIRNNCIIRSYSWKKKN